MIRSDDPIFSLKRDAERLQELDVLLVDLQFGIVSLVRRRHNRFGFVLVAAG